MVWPSRRRRSKTEKATIKIGALFRNRILLCGLSNVRYPEGESDNFTDSSLVDVFSIFDGHRATYR
jgi:hypothetical protein